MGVDLRSCDMCQNIVCYDDSTFCEQCETVYCSECFDTNYAPKQGENDTQMCQECDPANGIYDTDKEDSIDSTQIEIEGGEIIIVENIRKIKKRKGHH
jgi:predicted sulfurtransferase